MTATRYLQKFIQKLTVFLSSYYLKYAMITMKFKIIPLIFYNIYAQFYLPFLLQQTPKIVKLHGNAPVQTENFLQS